MKNLLIGLFALTTIFTLSCKSLKKGDMAFHSHDLQGIEKAVNANAFYFNFLKIKSKTRAGFNGDFHNLNMQIRMERDKRIWISATALLGIEVARMLITPDSVYVLNMLQREFTAQPLSYLKSFTSAEMSLKQMQDLLIGNPITLYKGAIVDRQNDSILVQKKVAEFTVTEFFHPDVAKIARMKIAAASRQAEANIYYSGFQQCGDRNIPAKVNIFVNTLQNAASGEFDYKEIIHEENLDFPFSVPASYKRN